MVDGAPKAGDSGAGFAKIEPPVPKAEFVCCPLPKILLLVVDVPNKEPDPKALG